MMADAVFSLEKLKKQFKTSQNRAVNFGFNPGNKENEQMLLLDHVKGPKTLGKIARFEGSSSKMACGTLDSTSGIAVFTCESPLPGMAKRIKRLFSRAKIQRKVQIVGPNGEIFEEAADENDETNRDGDSPKPAPAPEAEQPPAAAKAPEEPAPAGKAADEQAALWQERYAKIAPLADKVLRHGLGDPKKIQAARNFLEAKADAGDYAAALKNLPTFEKLLRAAVQAKGAGQAGAASGSPDSESQADGREIAARLRAERERAMELPVPQRAKLAEAFKQAIDQIKAGDLDKAAAMVARIAGAIDKLLRAGAAAKKPAAASADANALQALAKRLQALKTDIIKLEGQDLRNRLIGDLKESSTLIKAGDADGAEKRIVLMEKALADGQARHAAAAKGDAREEAPASADAQAILKDLQSLTPRLRKAIETAPDRKAALLAVAASIKSNAEAGDTAGLGKAAQDLQRLTAALDKLLGTAPATGFSIQKLGVARLEWSKTRQKAMTDMEELKGEIKELYADTPEHTSQVTAAMKRLDDIFKTLNEDLEDDLDKVLNAAETARADPIRVARATMKKFQDFIAGDPVLAAIDGNEILSEISIREPMSGRLKNISQALGA